MNDINECMLKNSFYPSFNLNSHSKLIALQILLLANNPLVTIAIPIYNKRNSIKQAVQSALDQTYKNIQILLVDDGSSDDSVLQIQEYLMLNNVKLIQLPENRGTLYARTISIINASEYILFLDGDDLLFNNITELAVKNIKDADCIWFNMYVQRSNSFSIQPETSPENLQFIQEMIQHKKRFFTFCSKMFKTDLLIKALLELNIVLQNKIVISEDLLILSAWMNLEPEIKFLNAPGYINIENSESTTMQTSNLKDSALLNRYQQDYFAKSIAITYFKEIELKIGYDFCELIWWRLIPLTDNCQDMITLLYSCKNAVCDFEIEFFDFSIEKKDEISKCFTDQGWSKYKLSTSSAPRFKTTYNEIIWHKQKIESINQLITIINEKQILVEQQIQQQTDTIKSIQETQSNIDFGTVIISFDENDDEIDYSKLFVNKISYIIEKSAQTQNKIQKINIIVLVAENNLQFDELLDQFETQIQILTWYQIATVKNIPNVIFIEQNDQMIQLYCYINQIAYLTL
ncbi:Glycosyl_transferase family 2 protein [Hexamita inflata]|uniref:Glycosyl transferase family 2 protein n=1 Tax=Hexamita inflata TaxID=28002 RepID=A0AA86NWX2_9EUKA|nr:Glycosyl transferase family 2 protein [Hexamita inflata]